MGNKCSIQSPIKPLKQCAITSSALVALTLHDCQHLESFKMHCDELFDHGIKTALMHIHAFDLNTFVHGFKGRGREGGWYSPTPKQINLKISHCKIIKNRHRTHSLANKIISRNPPPLRKMSGSEHDINILKEMTIGWAASLTWTITSNLHASLTHLFTPNGYSNLSDPYLYISVYVEDESTSNYLVFVYIHKDYLFYVFQWKTDFLRDPLEFVLILRNIVLFSSE